MATVRVEEQTKSFSMNKREDLCDTTGHPSSVLKPYRDLYRDAC
jgi:hypothetical protein